MVSIGENYQNKGGLEIHILAHISASVSILSSSTRLDHLNYIQVLMHLIKIREGVHGKLQLDARFSDSKSSGL